MSSSTTESTVLRFVEGRTTIRSEPIWETWEEMRLEMLPMRERIKIIEATPIEMPKQVKNERVRFWRREDFASS